MCEAMDPPRPGDPIYTLWREDPVPEVGDVVEVPWADFVMHCRVDTKLPSRKYDGERRRLHMTVVG